MELHLCISKESLIFTMILLYPPSSDILISVLTKPLFRMRKVKTKVQPFNLGLLKPILRFQPNFSQLTSYFFTSGFPSDTSHLLKGRNTTEHLVTTVGSGQSAGDLNAGRQDWTAVFSDRVDFGHSQHWTVWVSSKWE